MGYGIMDKLTGKQAERNICLDFLRGIAILIVLFNHAIQANQINDNFSTCAVRFYSHTTKLGTQIQWICSFLGHYKRNLSLSEPDILIVILIDHFDSSKGTASML